MTLALVDPDDAARHDGALDRLRRVADRVCPVVLAGEQVLPVLGPLVPLFPDGGLRRGSSVSIQARPGAGALSLTYAVAAGPVAAGSWVAMVGLASAGLVSAAELGVPLERVVSIRAPEPGQWAGVVAALVGAFDLVLVAPRHRVKHADARRLAARSRERGSVLLRVGGGGHRWPEGADLTLSVVAGRWAGLGAGFGHLRSRQVSVEVGGRREAARPRRHELLLPGPDGAVARAAVDDEVFAGADVDALVDPVPGPSPGWQAAG